VYFARKRLREGPGFDWPALLDLAAGSPRDQDDPQAWNFATGIPPAPASANPVQIREPTRATLERRTRSFSEAADSAAGRARGASSAIAANDARLSFMCGTLDATIWCDCGGRPDDASLNRRLISRERSPSRVISTLRRCLPILVPTGASRSRIGVSRRLYGLSGTPLAGDGRSRVGMPPGASTLRADAGFRTARFSGWKRRMLRLFDPSITAMSSLAPFPTAQRTRNVVFLIRSSD